jgi:hypothetical protein
MTTSYKVKFWDIRTNTRADKPGKKPRIRLPHGAVDGRPP